MTIPHSATPNVDVLLAQATHVEAIGPRRNGQRALWKNMMVTSVCLFAGAVLGESKPVHYVLDNVLGPSVRAVRDMVNTVSPTPVGVVAPQWLEEHSTPWKDALLAQLKQDSKSPRDLLAVADRDLLQKWGFSADHALALMLHMNHAYDAVSVPRPTPQLLANLAQNQQHSQKLLAQLWLHNTPDNRSALWQDQVTKNFLATPRGIQWQQTPSEEQKWRLLNSWWVSTAYSFVPTRKDMPELSLKEARAELQSVVDEVGLAALVVPFQFNDDAQGLQHMSAHLRQANAELQRVTGWTGPVLGMNHRIVLNNSFVHTDGRAILNTNGYTEVSSWWTTLAHEWFHVLDMSLSAAAQKSPSQLLSQQQKLSVNDSVDSTLQSSTHVDDAQRLLWQRIVNPVLSAKDKEQFAREAAHAPLGSTSPRVILQAIAAASQRATTEPTPASAASPWLYWRHQASGEVKRFDRWAYVFQNDDQDYLTNTGEILATALSAYVASDVRLYNERVLDDEDLWTNSYVSYDPSWVETNAQSMTWKRYFRQLQPWWQQDQHNRLGAVIAVSPSTPSTKPKSP